MISLQTRTIFINRNSHKAKHQFLNKREIVISRWQIPAHFDLYKSEFRQGYALIFAQTRIYHVKNSSFSTQRSLEIWIQMRLSFNFSTNLDCRISFLANTTTFTNLKSDWAKYWFLHRHEIVIYKQIQACILETIEIS